MLSFIAVMYVKMNFQRNCHVVLFGLLDVIEKGEICSKRPPGANGAALLDKNRAHNGQRGDHIFRAGTRMPLAFIPHIQLEG